MNRNMHLGQRIPILRIYILCIFGIISSGVFCGDVEIIKRLGQSRGIPGIDYPTYHSIPRTSFSCWQQEYNPGLYADTETNCQVFHSCFDHRQESFLCPIGTTFNQPILSCDYWYSSNCSLAPLFYHLNAKTEEEKVSDVIRYDEPSDIDYAEIETSMEEELPIAESQLIERMAELFQSDDDEMEMFDKSGPEVSFTEENFDNTAHYENIQLNNEGQQYEEQLETGHTPDEEIVFYYENDSDKQQDSFSYDDFVEEQSGLAPEDMQDDYVDSEEIIDIDSKNGDLYDKYFHDEGRRNSRFRDIELPYDTEIIMTSSDFNEQKYHDVDIDGSGYEVEVPMHAEDYFSIDLGSGDLDVLESELTNKNVLTGIRVKKHGNNDFTLTTDESEFLFPNENNEQNKAGDFSIDVSTEDGVSLVASSFINDMSENANINKSLIPSSLDESSTSKPQLITEITAEEHSFETHDTITDGYDFSTYDKIQKLADEKSINFEESETLNSEELSDAINSPNKTFNKRASRRRIVYIDPVDKVTESPKIPIRIRPKLTLIQEDTQSSHDRDLITSKPEEEEQKLISTTDETSVEFDASSSNVDNSYHQNSEFRILPMHETPEEIYQSEFTLTEEQINNDASHEVGEMLLADNQPRDMEVVYSYSPANRIQHGVLETSGHSNPYTSQANRMQSNGELALELEEDNDYSLASGGNGVTDPISGLPHIKTARGNLELFWEAMQTGLENDLESDQRKYSGLSEKALVENAATKNNHLGSEHIGKFNSYEDTVEDSSKEHGLHNSNQYQNQYTDYYILDEGIYAPGETHAISANDVGYNIDLQNDPKKFRHISQEILATNVDPERYNLDIEQIRKRNPYEEIAEESMTGLENLPFESSEEQQNYYRSVENSDKESEIIEYFSNDVRDDSLLGDYVTTLPEDDLTAKYRFLNMDEQVKYLQSENDQDAFQDTSEEDTTQVQHGSQDNDLINEDEYNGINDIHKSYIIVNEKGGNKNDVLISQTSDESQESSDTEESQEMTHNDSSKDGTYLDEMTQKQNSKDHESVTNEMPNALLHVKNSPIIAMLRQSFKAIPKKQMKQLQLQTGKGKHTSWDDVHMQMAGLKPVQHIPTIMTAADFIIDPENLETLSRVGRNLDKSKLSPGKLLNLKKAKLHLLKKYYQMFNY